MMTDMKTKAQEILEVMWFDHFETVTDKGSLAADILRELVSQLQYDRSDWTEPTDHMVIDVDDILTLCNELENLK